MEGFVACLHSWPHTRLREEALPLLIHPLRLSFESLVLLVEVGWEKKGSHRPTANELTYL